MKFLTDSDKSFGMGLPFSMLIMLEKQCCLAIKCGQIVWVHILSGGIGIYF